MYSSAKYSINEEHEYISYRNHDSTQPSHQHKWLWVETAEGDKNLPCVLLQR